MLAGQTAADEIDEDDADDVSEISGVSDISITGAGRWHPMKGLSPIICFCI